MVVVMLSAGQEEVVW